MGKVGHRVGEHQEGMRAGVRWHSTRMRGSTQLLAILPAQSPWAAVEPSILVIPFPR